jgi:hypothetical protein
VDATERGDEAVETRELKATDRCDRCGAQAKAVLETGAGDLLFCGHCAVQFCGDQVKWIGEPHLAGKA